MRDKEKIIIRDECDFHYDVILEYSPHWGFATAYYRGSIIGQVQLHKVTQPFGDDDREWEQYEERFSEWTDEIKTDIIPICQNHFNNQP